MCVNFCSGRGRATHSTLSSLDFEDSQFHILQFQNMTAMSDLVFKKTLFNIPPHNLKYISFVKLNICIAKRIYEVPGL